MFEILSFFTFFTILSNVLSLNEFSFKTLAYLSFIPVILTILISRNKENYVNSPKEVPEKISKDSKRLNFFVITGIFLCILVTIFSIRSEPDEGFYSSMETQAIERPELPLLKYDGMFGEEGIPTLHASYKFQSYQTLSAVTSYWSGILPPLVRHIIFPIIATIMFFLTWIKLLRLFIPDNWKSAIIIFISLIFLLGGYRSITGYSITRFYDGKCLLVNIIMPLFLYYSILYFRNPSNKKLIYLSIIQIAGLGLSSSALFLLPLQTIIIGIINWKPNRKQTKRCFLYGLSTIYLVTAGIFIKYKTMQNGLSDPSGIFLKISTAYYIAKIWPTILDALGGNSIAKILSLVSIFSAYRFLPKDSDLRKILLYTPLIVFFVILNPVLAKILSESFGRYIYWRLIYLVPLPLFITIFILGVSHKINVKFLKKSITVPLLILLLLALPYKNIRHEYQRANHSWNVNHLLLPRFEPKSYLIAQTIRNFTPKDTLALAPREISQCLAGMLHSPKLVAINSAGRRKTGYVIMLRDSFAQTADKRILLHRIVSGKVYDLNVDILSKYLRDLKVGSITFKKSLIYKTKLTKLLEKDGYKKTHHINKEYEIWLKIDPSIYNYSQK